MAAEPPVDERACQATFVLSGEGHTLANPLKHQLNRSPHVELAGYSVPHYSENAVNVRVQTTGEASAKDVMLQCFDELIEACDNIEQEFDRAMTEHDKVSR